tara:strand:+ start:120 stop:614 length:495 start_codon:yes stop_codon:yes gene_type:complete
MRLLGLLTKKKEEERQEVNLDDYFEQVTKEELDELALGKEITMRFMDKDVKGKIRCWGKSTIPFKDRYLTLFLALSPENIAYNFICRIDNEPFILSPIIPKDIESREYSFLKDQSSKMYKLGNNRFFLTGWSQEIDFNFIGKNKEKQYFRELDTFLRQGVLNFQ